MQDSATKFVEDLQSETKMLRIALYLFSGVGMFIAGFAAYRYWLQVKELRRTDRLVADIERVGFIFFPIILIFLGLNLQFREYHNVSLQIQSVE